MSDIQIPATISDQVNDAKDLEISYRTLHPYAILHDVNTNKDIKFPFSSIVSKYKDFLYEIIVEIELDDEEQEFYQYKPKMLSEDLYGTTELWDTILILNNAVSVSNFKPKTLKVYDPERLKSYLNEIMMLEEEAGNISY